MIQIALSEYLAEIDQLIEDQRFVESIAHCRHILQQHPRHIDTYRMLGKALLEQKNFHDAADVFQRVLSADPEDFIAHVGMSIIHKEDSLIPQAVWHMERAHEMDPYNQVIREELLDLYESRDKRVPIDMPLSRSALARLYFRGEMFQMAATELRQLIEQDESRVDLLTLLAETLWHDGQRVDAVDVCLEILEQLPNSVKANAILAEVWLATGRSDEAKEFLTTLGRLTLPDRENVVGSTLVNTVYQTDGAPELPRQQMINYLDYVPESGEEPDDIVPQWVGELDLVSEDAPADPDAAVVDDIPTPLPLTDVPDWFEDLRDDAAEVAIQPDEAAFTDATGSLDWLRDVAVSRSEPAAPPAEPEMDIVDEVMASSPTEDIPDWLGGILDDQEGDSLLNALIEEEHSLSVSEAPVQVQPTPEGTNDLDWLHEESAGTSSENESFTWLDNSPSPVVDGPDEDDESDFDWFEEELDVAAAIDQNLTGELSTGSADNDSFDDLDWLDDDEPETGKVIAADTKSAGMKTDDDTDLDWLEQALAASDDEEQANLGNEFPDSEMASAELDESIAQSESSPTVDTMVSSTLPDILPDVDLEQSPSGSEEQLMDIHDNPDNEEDEFPTESESSSAAKANDDDGLDWLQDLADADPTNSGVLRSADADQPLPDWLTQDIGQGSLPKELPDWLAEDALASGSDLSATVTDHEMNIPDIDRGTSELNKVAFPEGAPAADEESQEPISEIFGEGEIQEDLSWLDAMGAVEEPPTLSWDDSGVGQTPTEEPETPASGQLVIPTEEPETPASAQLVVPPQVGADVPAEAAVDWQDETVRMTPDEVAAMRAEAAAGAEELGFVSETPSEAEIAMDWLGELDEAGAADIEAPATEIVENSDPVLDAPAEAEDAMAWLEDLSASGDLNAGVTNVDDVDALSSSMASEDLPQSSELTWLDELSQPIMDVDDLESALQLDEDAAALTASGDSVGAKDLDSAEVMAWLDDLAEEPAAAEDGTVTEDELLPDLLGSAVEMPLDDVEAVAEEDSDAMAWLDDLANELADEEEMATTAEDVLDVAELPAAMAAASAFDIDGPDSTIEAVADTVSEEPSTPADAAEFAADPLGESSWLDDLIGEDSDSELLDTDAEMAELPDLGVAEPPEAVETPKVIVDGQEVPDLDIEPTEDIFSEEEAMSWMDDLLSAEADSVDSDLLATTAEVEEGFDAVPETPAPEADEVFAETAKVFVDGQEVPDLDIEPTEDIFSEEEAMSWMDDLLSAEAEAVDSDLLATTAKVEETIEAAAPETPVAEADEVFAEMPKVFVDGQEVPDLDIEPTEDIFSDAEALSWMEDLIGESELDDLLPESGTHDIPVAALASVDDEPASEAEVADLVAADPAGAPDEILAEADAKSLDELAAELAADTDSPVPETAQVVVDGQVVPDLDIEPTEDPLSEADAMAWLDEFISEVDQTPQDEALPDDIIAADEVTAVSAPVQPQQSDSAEFAAEADVAEAATAGEEVAEEGLAALAFLEELAMTGSLAQDSAEELVEATAAEPAESEPSAVADEAEAADEPAEQVVTRAMPTEPELSLEELADDIPEDPDEAMDWIRSMAEDEPEAPDEAGDMSWLDDLTSADDGIVPELDFSADEVAGVAMTASELPSILDQEAEIEAIAAGDRVTAPEESAEAAAAGDTEALDEMIIEAAATEADVGAEVVAEAEAAAQADEGQVADATDTDVEEPHPEPIAIADLPSASESAGDTESDMAVVADDTEAADEVEDLGELEYEPDLMNSQVEGTLPDWLLDDEDAAPDSIGWMEAIGDSSVTDWLTAEEETLSSTFEAVDPDSLAVPGTGPLDERKLSRTERGPIAEAKPDRPAEPLASEPEAEAEPATAATPEPPADMDMAQLQVGRAALEAKDFDRASTVYGELLGNGQGLDVLIDDLEQVQPSSSNALLIRLLGDIYMRDGQLQNALDRYRQALDLM